MKVHEAKDILEKQISEGFTKVGVFFAFSDKQFEEGKTHKEAPDNEYISIGHGGFIHKSNKESYINFTDVLVKQYEEEYKSKVKFDDVIEYELANYEYYYTFDIETAVDVIADLYSEIPKEEIIKHVRRVFHATLDHHKC